MDNSRGTANDAMHSIEEHYLIHLGKTGLKDNPIQKRWYYESVLRMLRNEPLPDEKAQSILEAKLSKKIYELKTKALHA